MASTTKIFSASDSSDPPQSLVSYQQLALPPVVPGNEVDDLCRKLDEFYGRYPLKHEGILASELVKAGFYAARSECRTNPDWRGQSAHSLREVLYPLYSNAPINIVRLYKQYVPQEKHAILPENEKQFLKSFVDLDDIYGKLTDISHHGSKSKTYTPESFSKLTDNDYDQLLSSFVRVLRAVLTIQQCYAHKLVDILVLESGNKSVEHVRYLLEVNEDVRTYFYAKADERWLRWLWKKGFLDVIKTKPSDVTRYSFRTPELRYLVRMAEVTPKDVTDILHAVPVTSETFNPEAIDQFLRICTVLPASELVRVVSGRTLVEKIRDEGWVRLMIVFNHSGYDYQKVFETLNDAGEYKAVVALAEAVLSVRPADEIKKTDFGTLDGSVFYFSDLSFIKVFEYLAKVDDAHAEDALQFVVSVFREVNTRAAVEGGDGMFTVSDGFHLYDTDIFELTLAAERSVLHRDDMRDLVALMKALSVRVVVPDCGAATSVRETYSRTIGLLPDTSTVFKFRLYLWSRCPEVFTAELKDAFRKLFLCADSYYAVLGGAEYLRALKETFAVVFSEDEKRTYVEKVVAYFVHKAEEHPDQDWHLGYAGRICSVIAEYIAQDNVLSEQITSAGIRIEPAFEPTASVSHMRSGTIHSRSPITAEEFFVRSIADNVASLRSEWAPEELRKKDIDKDFRRPLNAEGAGSVLKNDVKKRFKEYVASATLFFDPSALDLHYTYSFLRGIEEALRDNVSADAEVDWDPMFDLFADIQTYYSNNKERCLEHTQDTTHGWLAGWDGVYTGMTDVLRNLLRTTTDAEVLDFVTYRGRILTTLRHLLEYPDPEPKGEELGTASSTSNGPGDNKMLVSDPLSIAINSVRGRAFEALMMFVYRDGNSFKKEDPVRLREDVQALYIEVLTKERTRALFFLFGNYLPTFYYRAPAWTLERLPAIFPSTPEDYHLYLAGWEGFLSANLFEELFFEKEIQSLYHRGLHIKKEGTRRYHRDPEDGLTVHIGLATVAYHERFGFEHPLFTAFWKESTTKQKGEFVSNIGRLYISNDNKELSEKAEQERCVLCALWDWVLEHCTEPEVFAEFGFWINTEEVLFEHAWLARRVRQTLEKSHGELTWDFGLTQSIETLVLANPEDVLHIARHYLLEGGTGSERMIHPMRYDREWYRVIESLYKNADTREGTFELIDALIREGGSDYWELKKIILGTS